MRLDALLPVILIACLLALAYFLTKAVQAANAEADPPTTQVRLNPDDYQDPATTGSSSSDAGSSDASSSGSSETDLDHLYESGPSTGDRVATPGESYTPSNSDTESPTTNDSEASTPATTPPPPPPTRNETTTATNPTNSGTSTSSGGNTASTTRSASSGRYIVVTGSYRMRSNAERQVANLKREGFPNAEVEIFDRGTYALAIADRFSRHSEAEALVRRLVSSGFEAYVKEI